MKLSDFGGYHETKSHVPPGFPYNTYLCTIPLDFQSVPTHWHDELEMIVIKKGTGTVTVNLESRQVEAGDIVMITPGQLHAIGQYKETSMEYENILFRPELLKALTDDTCSDYLNPYFEGAVRYPAWITKDSSGYNELSGCIACIDDVCSKKIPGYQLAVKGFLFQFFYIYFREQRAEQELAPLKSLDKMKIIIRKIETEYQDKITVEEMAEAVSFSPSHFMKYFKQCMGTPFTQYLNDYRLTMASRMLSASGHDVITIAMESGFTNVSYFNRLFKAKFGITPREYRERCDNAGARRV